MLRSKLFTFITAKSQSLTQQVHQPASPLQFLKPFEPYNLAFWVPKNLPMSTTSNCNIKGNVKPISSLTSFSFLNLSIVVDAFKLLRVMFKNLMLFRGRKLEGKLLLKVLFYRFKKFGKSKFIHAGHMQLQLQRQSFVQLQPLCSRCREKNLSFVPLF